MKVHSLVIGLALVTASLTVVATEVQASEEPRCDSPYDVSVVLDRSGSMAGDKIQTARDGASQLVRSLSTTDQSGLVSYSSSATLDQPLTFDHEATATAIESLAAGGSTATGDAIDLAHDDIQTNARTGVDDVMILLTDGITNTGSDPVVEAQEAKDDGIEIFAIGLGDNINEQDLRDIASTPTEEHFFNPKTTEELLAIFEVLQEELRGPTVGESHALRAHASASTDDRLIVDPVAQATSPPDTTEAVVDESITVGDYTVELGAVEDESSSELSPERVASTSTARIASVTISNQTHTLVAADTLQARSSSQATPDVATASADGTRLAGLEVMGTSVDATVPPNTVVPIGEDAQLVLNEQIEETSDGFASLRVNLIHLTAELPDGDALSLVVSSAYSAAECDPPEPLPSPQEAADPPLRYDGPDEEETVGPVSVNRGGCTTNLVAISGSGCAYGNVAASGFGEAGSPLGVAASGFGPASSQLGAAVSGTGPAYTLLGASASGTGDAVGLVAVSGTGDTTGLVLFSLTGECNEMECYDVQPADDAEAWTLAISGDGSSKTWVGASAAGTGSASNEVAGASVSGTGPAYTPIGAAVSGAGPASTGLGAAVSGTNDASGLAAVSGTGDAEGTVLFSATGECNSQRCYDVNPTGSASAWTLAVSGTDDSSSVVGVAVSGTGDAKTTTGAAVSGCTGVQLELIVLSASAPSPVPVCAVP